MTDASTDAQSHNNPETPSPEEVKKVKEELESAKADRARYLRLAAENRDKVQRLTAEVEKLDDAKKRTQQEHEALKASNEQEKTKLNAEITDLENKKIIIESGIDELEAVTIQIKKEKTDSEEALSAHNVKYAADVKQMADDRQKVSDELADLRGKRASLHTECESLVNERTNLEANVKLWRVKHNLYSNDLAGIGEENKKQQERFIGSAVLSFVGAALMMWLLICSIKADIQLPQWVVTLFSNEHGYVFGLIVLTRISVVISLFVLIFVFLNLTRGFVVQLIRTQGKMASVRMLDFLSTRVGKETVDGLSADDLLKYETDKLSRQSDLLTKHIPDLIDYRASEFERTSNTESPHTGVRKFFTKGKADRESADG